MNPRSLAALALATLCLALATQSQAQETDDDTSFSEGEKLFALKVKPLIAEKCFSCHGDDPDEIEGALDLRTRAGMLKGGDTADDILLPGEGEDSLLYIAATWTDEDYEMPPKENDRLSQEQTEWLRDWIDAGAPWPDENRLAAIQNKYATGVIVKTSGALSEEWAQRRYSKENLWAYQKITDTPIPKNSSPHTHPIDAFIEQRLARYDLAPAPPADRRTLIRRATFDLLGLPPAPQEIAAFLQDPQDDDDAFADLVDRLLADPRYGEQWARHWLDVVRYADTAGYSNDFERPHAWRYRDYVIRSLNTDKPYDRFIKEQIAGDELYPDDTEALIATGFLRMGPWEHTSMSVAKLTRQQFLDDVTDSVGQTFLSHPLQCARCHDHKFDPIPTKDYYRIQATFATTQFVDRDSKFLDTENLAGFEAEDALYQKRIERASHHQKQLNAKQKAAIEKWCEDRGIPVASERELRSEKIPEDQRLPRNYGLTNQDIGYLKVLNKIITRAKGERARYTPRIFSVYSGATQPAKNSHSRFDMPADPLAGGEIPTSHILTGGDPFANGDEVTPGVFSALPHSNDTVEPNDFNRIPTAPIGRRAAFANWLASPQNSITPRSIVNRVWHYHFGQGIVATPNNFGAMGKKPTHPELLDFLSKRFIENGWSLKTLHREIMLSQTYRRSSNHPDPDQLAAKDPLGETYAAFKPRRLSAEEIRDSTLFISGELNPLAGGIPIRPEINREVALQPRQVMGSFAAAYEASQTPADRNRRTLYAHKIRGLRYPFLEVFNQPSPDLSCEARDSSTVTPQAFSRLNSEDTLKRSSALALSLIQNTNTRKEAVEMLFLRAYGRKPDRNERRLCLKHWTKMEKRHQSLEFEPYNYPTTVNREAVEEMTGESYSFAERLFAYEDYTPDPDFSNLDASSRALADLCLVILNSNEFLYVY